MKFELINPSDPYTIEGADLMIVAVAACLLGDGRYGLDGLGEAEGVNMPIFILASADEWFREKFSMNYEGAATYCVHKRGEELAQALDSVTLVSDRRSSLNDICWKAQQMARAVREAAKAEA